MSHNSSFPQVEGYQLTQELYRASRTAVYRGISATKQNVVIKLLCSSHPSCRELAKFRNQYVVTSNLSINGIVKPLELKPWGNGYALIMEDFGGLALGDYARDQRLSWQAVLDIALQIADILHHLHQARVIHKDIKPDNLLIHPKTKQIQLIDFSLASLLPKTDQALRSPNALEGTLAYIAPEQTGRMSRGIDYRADFYSFGVTLYELLTGGRPFQSHDPMELIHCHIARSPVPPWEVSPTRSIAKPIGEIVLKLMAKNAEDRYQSALGLKHDLQRCLNQWQESGQIETFELGKQDRCDRFLIPNKLYGREATVQALLDAFERVSKGASELMLVAGYSGVGKTAVVKEACKFITQKKGFFIQGKFDQLNRDIPFSAFVQSFRCLMGQLLGESDTALKDWKAKILTAVGESAQVLIEVIPELEQIIGKQPLVPELSGDAAQNRFNLLFGKFVGVFSTPDHPLVIFLDDLQWADSASLNLFKLLIDQDSAYLLVLGAYRNNEVLATHPLMLILTEAQKWGVALNILTLKPLRERDIEHLVADTLHCSPETTRALTQLVYQRNQGNPFFTTQFLRDLYNNGWINLNRETGDWQYHLQQIQQLALADDVIAFMVDQLHQLPSATQAILKLSACIGNQFDLRTLAAVCECSQADAAANLWPSLQMGLVVPSNRHYRFSQDMKNIQTNGALADGIKTFANGIENSYCFLHDSVQKSAYALIPEDQKSQIHWHLGQLLTQEISRESQDARIFELVSHLNHGADHITDKKLRDEVASLNLQACKKAKRTVAYQAGYEYAAMGLSWLDTRAWERQYDLGLQLYNFAAEFAWLCGDFKTMNRHIQTILERSQSLLDKILAFCLRIQAQTAQMQFAEALKTAQHVFECLELPLPSDTSLKGLPILVSEVDQLLSKTSISELESLPEMTQQSDIAVIQTISQIIPAAYICGSPLFPVVVILGVKRLIRTGNSPLSAYIYANYAYILCNYCKAIETGEEFGKIALKLANKPNAKSVRPQVFVMLALYMQHRKASLKTTLNLASQGYNFAQEVGNHQWAGYSAYAFCANGFASGQNLADLKKMVQVYWTSLVKIGQIAPANWCQIYRQIILQLTDDSSPYQSIFFGDSVQESEFLAGLDKAEDLLGLYHFHLCKLIIHYLLDNLEVAHSHALEARSRLDVAQGTVGLPVFYFYDSLILLNQLNEIAIDSEEGLQKLQWVEQNQKLLKQDWAKHAPVNYQHKFKLVEAKKASLLGARWAALELYEEAIADAKDHAFPQEEALANELAAKFYLKWNKEKVAAGYMQEAYDGYMRWGAKAKANSLEHAHPSLLQPILRRAVPTDSLETLADVASFNLSRHSSTTSTSSPNSNTQLDFAAVLEAAQLLSEKIQLEELLVQLVQLMLQNSGADKLAILLPGHNDRLHVRAIATVETIKLLSEPLVDYEDLPIQLIQYSKNTKEVIVIDHPDTELPIVDTYLQQQQPYSILSLPILYQGNLRGLLYLQNQSLAGVFSRERILIVNFLCAQAAIALENARLYQLEQARAIALAASEGRLQTLFDQAADAVLLMREVEQGFIDCNEATLNLFGCTSKDDILGLLPSQVSPARQPGGQFSKDKAQLMMETALEKGSTKFEWLYQRLNGETFWTEVTLTSIGYQEEKLFHCTVRDISDRKRYEQKILESKAFLQTVLDTFPLSIFWKDCESHYIGVNQNFIEDAGFQDTDEIVGLTDFDMPWAETQAQSYRADDQEVMLSDSPKIGIIETQLQADGTQIWLETNKLPLHDLDGHVIGVMGTYQDITARKRSEKQLRELSERLELAMDSAQIGVWEWDYKKETLSWDERMFSIFGIQPDDFRGTFQDWEKCVHPDDLDHAKQGAFPTAPSRDNNNQSTKEYRIIQPDGTVRHVLSTAVIQWDQQGNLSRAIGMNLDITDQKVAEARLKLTNDELLRATRLKDEFLANMSHELRTPLNAILGMTEGLEGGMLGELNEKQLNAVKITRQSGIHLLELINEILDLAKIESGQVELVYSEASVSYLCESSLIFVKQQALKQGVRLYLQVPSSLQKIEVDERRIRQVLINLLDNAVKFTPKDGNVTLTVALIPPDDSHEQSYLSFTIADTGIGIASDNLKKLFQPFIQIDGSLNRQYDGTGLGLALVKQIVELHGGNVAVTSELGIGSQFMIELPYSNTSPQNISAELAAKPALQPSCPTDKISSEVSPLILLVEDNEASVQTISNYLEAQGYHLQVASNGEVAIEMAQAETPALILMDIQMPGMDGLVATQHIRQIQALKHTPIVALTALAMEGDQERCLAAGVDHYMSKPIRLKELTNLIQKLLKSHNGESNGPFKTLPD